MVFYDAVAKTGIVQDTWFRIWGNSEDHSDDYPLADVTRNVNRYYDKVVTKILQSDKTWRWDDANKTDLPIIDLNIVNGQIDYGISGATYLKVNRVEIKDQNGSWKQLNFFTADQVVRRALNDLAATAGTPSAFRLQGNSIFFDIPPNYSSTGGLRIFYQRNVDYFVAADTTKVPGFAEMFHEILSAGAALEYCQSASGMDEKLAMLQNLLLGTFVRTKGRIGGLFNELQEFYENRNDNKISMSTRKEDFGERALGGASFPGRSSGNPLGF